MQDSRLSLPSAKVNSEWNYTSVAIRFHVVQRDIFIIITIIIICQI
jgi:hypothetical protein